MHTIQLMKEGIDMTNQRIELTKDVSFAVLDETKEGKRVSYRMVKGYKNRVTHEVIMLIGSDNEVLAFLEGTNVDNGILSPVPLSAEDADLYLSVYKDKSVDPYDSKIYDKGLPVEVLDCAGFVILRGLLDRPNTYSTNHKETNRPTFKEIIIGTPCTTRYVSDCYPGVVTKVSPSGKQITIRQIQYEPAPDYHHYMNQENIYHFDQYTSDDIIMRKTKNGWAHKLLKCSFGHARAYRDPSF